MSVVSCEVFFDSIISDVGYAKVNVRHRENVIRIRMILECILI